MLLLLPFPPTQTLRYASGRLLARTDTSAAKIRPFSFLFAHSGALLVHLLLPLLLLFIEDNSFLFFFFCCVDTSPCFTTPHTTQSTFVLSPFHLFACNIEKRCCCSPIFIHFFFPPRCPLSRCRPTAHCGWRTSMRCGVVAAARSSPCSAVVTTAAAAVKFSATSASTPPRLAQDHKASSATYTTGLPPPQQSRRRGGQLIPHSLQLQLLPRLPLFL